MGTITHETAEQFYRTIEAMAYHAIPFKADASRLTVTLGYRP
jgi:hypothetical protein